jgi:hypothetical protein
MEFVFCCAVGEETLRGVVSMGGTRSLWDSGGKKGRGEWHLSSSPPNCLVIRRRENIEPKMSFASSSFDKALGFTPGMISVLLLMVLLVPDCRWACLRDWDQRLLYMHSAWKMLGFR